MLRTLRGFTLAAIAAICMASAPGASGTGTAFAQDAEAGAFILDLGERAVTALTDREIPQEERQERFRTLLNTGLDLEFVGGYVLGVYRRQTDAEQMGTFLELLEENIVQNYAWRFRNYTGEELHLLRTREGGRDSTIVETELEQLGDAPPVRVAWRVHRKDGELKIIDIVVEGISMMVTQRDEYVGFMRANGGVDALIDALRKQNAALAERRQQG
ncbi:MAG: ABC transporter substrate-binding protein [Alphaproteobacteria bacterium]|nr:ABC transporter substrate-binding protein [Alphaproteobacteria bacterium]